MTAYDDSIKIIVGGLIRSAVSAVIHVPPIELKASTGGKI